MRDRAFLVRAVLILVSLFMELGLALGTKPAFATPLNAWEHLCITDAEDNSRLCTTEYHLMQDDQEFVLYFAHNPRGTSPFVVEGPEGLLQGVVVTVDDNDALTSSNCEPDLCFFEKEPSAALLKQFRRGKEARLEIMGVENQHILDHMITLLGFTAAYGQYRQ